MAIDPDVRPRPVRARRYLWGLVVAIGIACLVALSEINAQSGRVVDAQGRAWPIAVLVGPDHDERRAGWPEVISGLIDLPLYRALVSWYLAIDLIFMITYGALLIGLVVKLFSRPPARIVVGGLVACTVFLDLIENVCILGLMVAGNTGLATVLLWTTTGKWVVLALVLIALLVRFVVPQRPRPVEDLTPLGLVAAVPDLAAVDAPRATVGRTLRALMHHRFSVAMVIPLIVLTMLSGSAILEQLPDVQRRWVSDGPRGWLQALCAVLALLGVGLVLELLARFRSGWADRHQTVVGPPPPDPVTSSADGPVTPTEVTSTPAPATGDSAGASVQTTTWNRALLRRLARDMALLGSMIIDAVTRPGRFTARVRYLADRHDALLALWLLGVIIPLVAAAIASFVLDAPVLVGRLLVFCAVPVVVVVVSWVLRRAWQIRPDWYVPDRPPEFTSVEVSTIWFTGRALALAAVTVGGIGLIRSYISVVALGPAITGVGSGGSIFFLVLGIVGVVLPWLISWAMLAGDREIRYPFPTIGSAAPIRLRARWGFLGGVLVMFVGIALFPGPIAMLGVSAVAVLSLTMLIGIAAAAGLLIQERPTAEIFRILGLRRTPLVSVLLIAIVLGGLTVGGSTIHQVASTPGDPAPAARPPVGTMVQTWLDQPGACEVEVDGQRVRPMIMIAAEGGGIRAAYWTVKGLAALEAETGGCAASSTLFSGGASGGSVGLTVARFSGTPDDPGTSRAVTSVQAMAEPETLGQAVIGTFVRDPVYATTGVPLGTFGVAPAGTWADRARLIELGWDDSGVVGSGGDDSGAVSPWGPTDYLTSAGELSPATGPLVLNSSSVASQCRAWVSQLELEQPGATDGEQRCDRRVGPGARTVDVLAAYGPVAGSGSDCLGTVSASTAALLTARFPYVTPGGVVGGCDLAGGAGFWPRTQLIDGGYIENTGLATVTDLSAWWLSQIRAHNDQVVAGRSTDPLIMPFVVFLTNEQATAGRLTEPPALQSELLLPAVGYLRGSATLTQTDALLQRVSTTVRTRSICPPPGTGPVDCDAIADAFPRRVIVIDRTAQPEVTAPLGWVLSQASMTGLDRAMQHQVSTTCTTNPSEPSCLRGYGTLGELLTYLRR